MHKSSSVCFERDTRNLLKNINCTASLDCSQNQFRSAFLHLNIPSCILCEIQNTSLSKQKLGISVNSQGIAVFAHTYTSARVLTVLVFIYPQGCPEIESVFQEEEAAPCAPRGMWSTPLSHQLQWHPAGVSSPRSTLPLTGSQQGQRHSWHGQGRISNIVKSLHISTGNFINLYSCWLSVFFTNIWMLSLDKQIHFNTYSMFHRLFFNSSLSTNNGHLPLVVSLSSGVTIIIIKN